MEVLFNTSAVITPEGRLIFEERLIDYAAKELKQPETRNVRILIIQDFKESTKKQLAYYHGFLIKDVIRAFESIGENITEVEADKQMRELFLFHYDTSINSGRKRKIVHSLEIGSVNFPSTKEMSELFEDILRYCVENMNFIIHLPDDMNKEIDLNFNRL